MKKTYIIILGIVIIGGALFFNNTFMQPNPELDTKQSFIAFLNNEIKKEKEANPPGTKSTTYSESDIECDSNKCKVKLVTRTNNASSRATLSFRKEGEEWVIDREAMTPQVTQDDKLINQYNLCVYVQDPASLTATLNGNVLKLFSKDNADGISICSPLVPQVGSNTIVLTFGTLDSDKKEISYGYDLRGAPKDVSASELIFDDSYIIKAKEPIIVSGGTGVIVSEGKGIVEFSFQAE